MSPRNQCDPVEGMRDACAAIAARLANDVSRRSDRLTDYDRGELAAARHIEREIRALRAGSGQPAAGSEPVPHSASCDLPAASSDGAP